ncbi:MAG: hypothetical protein ABIO70_21675 [Pseudomonadota bacterium]
MLLALVVALLAAADPVRAEGGSALPPPDRDRLETYDPDPDLLLDVEAYVLAGRRTVLVPQGYDEPDVEDRDTALVLGAQLRWLVFFANGFQLEPANPGDPLHFTWAFGGLRYRHLIGVEGCGTVSMGGGPAWWGACADVAFLTRRHHYLRLAALFPMSGHGRSVEVGYVLSTF